MVRGVFGDMGRDVIAKTGKGEEKYRCKFHNKLTTARGFVSRESHLQTATVIQEEKKQDYFCQTFYKSKIVILYEVSLAGHFMVILWSF